ncbi:hypothetical protein [Photorhabdus bodei]|uniref:Uncharacterized protein n=1 Tax=Photorhabdus bodei TaxID=2029681 RepID=A0AAW6BRC3_9GAMM|nr:hypothetical protein [Photorhabdus bodei]MDB6374259.1 hypothetical protein [Photorhabdus bodei]
MNIRNIITIFFYLVGILFFNNLAYSKDENGFIFKKIKEFVYVNGKPHSLSSVYNIETPDGGFSSFYVYFWKKNEAKIYPFVYEDEKERKRSGNDYSRCNVFIVNNRQVAIPIRKFQSGSAEDFEPCLGYNTGYREVKSPGHNINWFIFRVVYEDANLNSHETYEVYFISEKKNKFCYSERITELINKKKMLDINNEIPKGLDFDECGNFVK